MKLTDLNDHKNYQGLNLERLCKINGVVNARHKAPNEPVVENGIYILHNFEKKTKNLE